MSIRSSKYNLQIAWLIFKTLAKTIRNQLPPKKKSCFITSFIKHNSNQNSLTNNKRALLVPYKTRATNLEMYYEECVKRKCPMSNSWTIWRTISSIQSRFNRTILSIPDTIRYLVFCNQKTEQFYPKQYLM